MSAAYCCSAIRNARWKRRDVPVHVRVALVAAEAQHVEPFGRYRLADGSTDAVDAALELDVLVGGERVDHVGAVFERGDQCVAEQRRPLGEERDTYVVAEDHEVIVPLAGHDGADEARAGIGSARSRVARSRRYREGSSGTRAWSESGLARRMCAGGPASGSMSGSEHLGEDPGAARRADRPTHASPHADASGRARERVPAHVGPGARLCAARRRGRDEPSRGRRRRARAAALACSDDARGGLSIPRIALRHRLQNDVHGLDRSRHRMIGEDGKLVHRARRARRAGAAGARRGAGRGVVAAVGPRGRARRDPPSRRGSMERARRPTWRCGSSRPTCGTTCARRWRRRARGCRAVRPTKRVGAASPPTSAGRWRCSACARAWRSNAKT